MRFSSVLLAALVLAAPPVWAGDQGALTLTVDKAQILHLAAPAQRVIVANPAIADVTVEKPTLITLFGKASGETSLTVLGADDQEILSRSIVVTGAGDHTVTVHAPSGQGQVSREYVCVGERCSKVGGDSSPSGASSSGGASAAGGGSTPPR